MAHRLDVDMADDPASQGSTASALPDSLLDAQLDAQPDSPTSSTLSVTVTPFLDRPPEIRNLIYEALFQPATPKTLLMDRDSLGGYRSTLRLSIPGINLLFACRQIYQEAASFLYSKTVFILSVDFDWMEIYFDVGDLIETAGWWLTSIGANRTVLRDVRIDLNFVRARFDILHLVQSMFDLQQFHHLPIAFTSRAENIPHNVLNVDALNVLLRSLPTHPHLKTLLRCWRLLSRVILARNGKFVEVYFGPNPYSDMKVVRFSITNQDTLCHTPPFVARSYLEYIIKSSEIRNKIFKDLNQLDKSMKFDFDCHTISRAWPQFLHVNRRLRYFAGRVFGSGTLFFDAKVNDCDSNDGGFEKLKSFLDSNYPLGQKSSGKACVRLNVVANYQARVEDVRLNALEILAVMQHLDKSFGVSYVAMRMPGPRARYGAAMRLSSIKDRLFVYLAKLLAAHPSHALHDCPIIWMDGQARMCEAEFRYLQVTVQNKAKESVSSEPTDEELIESVRMVKEKRIEHGMMRSDTTLLGRAFQYTKGIWYQDQVW